MEDNIRISKVVELIFGKKATIPEEIIANSIPSSLLTEDFLDKFNVILHLRKYIISYRWKDFLLDEYTKILSSHRKYLECVFAACFCEHECSQNIFDAFIRVCALLKHFIEETLEKTGVDFSDLSSDIFQVFYRQVLKISFLTQGGFHTFVAYICGHKHLQWIRNDHTLSDVNSASVFLVPDEKMNEELNRYHSFQEVSCERESAMEEAVIFMVNEVLSNTSVELPALPSEPDLIARLVSSRVKDLNIKDDINIKAEASAFKVPRGYSSSKFNVKTDYFVDQQENTAWHEKIVQAVTRYNHSKDSDHENADSQIQEVEMIEKNLISTINSLIEVLNECYNE